MSVLIKGGRVVTAADDYVADVFGDALAERSHSRVDYNLYEGTEVTGRPRGRARAGT